MTDMSRDLILGAISRLGHVQRDRGTVAKLLTLDAEETTHAEARQIDRAIAEMRQLSPQQWDELTAEIPTPPR